jgi:Uma2 family endonuclease
MAHLTLDNQPTGEQRLKMSYEDFCSWSLIDIHAEWVNGEVTVFTPPRTIHALLTSFLSRLIHSYTEFLNLGTVIIAPFEMRLIPDKISREPDILFIARENRERLTPERLEGAADLVVEIISNESAFRDRRVKYKEYEQAGVGEYWLIDPRPGRQQIELYRRTLAGSYTPIQPDEQGRYHSAVLPGFWLRPAWLWQEPLPNPLLTLLQMQVLPPEVMQTIHNAIGEQKQAP